MVTDVVRLSSPDVGLVLRGNSIGLKHISGDQEIIVLSSPVLLHCLPPNSYIVTVSQ